MSRHGMSCKRANNRASEQTHRKRESTDRLNSAQSGGRETRKERIKQQSRQTVTNGSTFRQDLVRERSFAGIWPSNIPSHL
eukprot:1362574-Rhodomonas_salina.2